MQDQSLCQFWLCVYPFNLKERQLVQVAVAREATQCTSRSTKRKARSTQKVVNVEQRALNSTSPSFAFDPSSSLLLICRLISFISQFHSHHPPSPPTSTLGHAEHTATRVSLPFERRTHDTQCLQACVAGASIPSIPSGACTIRPSKDTAIAGAASHLRDRC